MTLVHICGLDRAIKILTSTIFLPNSLSKSENTVCLRNSSKMLTNSFARSVRAEGVWRQNASDIVDSSNEDFIRSVESGLHLT